VIGLRQTRAGEIAPRCSSELAGEISRCDALLIGPGMQDPRGAVALVERCVAAKAKAALVVDAAALAAFGPASRSLGAHDTGLVLTPHAGEMARLWGIRRTEVAADPRAIAREAAAQLNAIVVLKGAETFIAAPDGTTFRNTAGNLGLGTSGSGDTLAGVIAGLCARGADPLQAAVWGVSLHAQAGEALARKLGPLGFLARELLTEIPPLLARHTR
jgi:ADP-dependent NAD(P)H-hydrate dehydratase